MIDKTYVDQKDGWSQLIELLEKLCRLAVAKSDCKRIDPPLLNAENGYISVRARQIIAGFQLSKCF